MLQYVPTLALFKVYQPVKARPKTDLAGEGKTTYLLGRAQKWD